MTNINANRTNIFCENLITEFNSWWEDHKLYSVEALQFVEKKLSNSILHNIPRKVVKLIRLNFMDHCSCRIYFAITSNSIYIPVSLKQGIVYDWQIKTGQNIFFPLKDEQGNYFIPENPQPCERKSIRSSMNKYLNNLTQSLSGEDKQILKLINPYLNIIKVYDIETYAKIIQVT